MVGIGEWRIVATARVLDPETDRKLWDQIAAIANRKYGWGDGLPVEITPLPSGAPHSGYRIGTRRCSLSGARALVQRENVRLWHAVALAYVAQ